MLDEQIKLEELNKLMNKFVEALGGADLNVGMVMSVINNPSLAKEVTDLIARRSAFEYEDNEINNRYVDGYITF